MPQPVPQPVPQHRLLVNNRAKHFGARDGARVGAPCWGTPRGTPMWSAFWSLPARLGRRFAPFDAQNTTLCPGAFSKRRRQRGFAPFDAQVLCWRGPKTRHFWPQAPGGSRWAGVRLCACTEKKLMFGAQKLEVTSSGPMLGLGAHENFTSCLPSARAENSLGQFLCGEGMRDSNEFPLKDPGADSLG